MRAMSDMGLRRARASCFFRYSVFGWLLLGLIACSPLPPETIPSVTYPPTSTAQVAPSLTSAATRVGLSASATPAPVSTPVSDGGNSLDPGTDSGAVAPTVVEPEMTEPATPARQAIEHTVEVGDTLLGMALQYDVPMAAIQIENELGEETAVQAGWVLVIPPATGWQDALPFWTTYLVKEKDTLIGIAASHHLDATVLATVNGISDAGLLAVGQTLILPLTAVQAPEPTQPPPQPAPDTSESAGPVSEPSPTPALINPLPESIAGWPHPSSTGCGPSTACPPLRIATRWHGRLNSTLRIVHSAARAATSDLMVRARQPAFCALGTRPRGRPSAGCMLVRPRLRWISGWTRRRPMTRTGGRCSAHG